MSDKKIAVLDIGTNTVLLLIAGIFPDKTYRILHDECAVVRLGEGIHHEPRFLPAAMQRTKDLLQRYRQTIDRFVCEQILAVGTACLRRAENADVFCADIKKSTGIDIEIISGEKEARLIYLASRGDFPDLATPLLVLDIGGGSTEFIFAKTSGEILENSLNFGVVKLTECFLHADPPTPKQVAELTQFVREKISCLPCARSDPLHMIATAGTPTTLCALSQKMPAYEADRVHGQRLSLVQIETLTERLSQMTFQERAKLPCLSERRADVILAGAHILLCVMRHFGLKELVVSDHGLRYGVLMDFLSGLLRTR